MKIQTSEMEKTVDTLEAMFQKAESDLNYLSRKVEHEFDQNNEENKTNPAKLIQRITDIKKEFSDIVQEASAIQEAQKEAAEFFRSQLMTACQLLQKIQLQGSLENAERPEELDKLEEILGVKFPCGDEKEPSSGTTNCTAIKQEEEVDLTFTIEEESPQATSSPEPILSPASRRAESNEFIEVTQKEFEMVSSLVRGRVKLSDVNMVYRVLWRHFKEEHNSNPLNPSEMYKMGLKVTGATGEAKLKVLRALKLCTISKKMEVKLL